MKDIVLTPGKEAALYCSVVGLLCFISFYIFPNDFKTWLMLTFCIYGLLVTYCIRKGIGALRRAVKK